MQGTSLLYPLNRAGYVQGKLSISLDLLSKVKLKGHVHFYSFGNILPNCRSDNFQVSNEESMFLLVELT